MLQLGAGIGRKIVGGVSLGEREDEGEIRRTGNGVAGEMAGGREAQILLNPHNCDNGALFVISRATL